MTGVEIAANGDLSAQNLTGSGRREVRHLLRSHDLQLSAVFCPLRHGLDVVENQQARIDYVSQAMTLSFDLGPRLTIIQAGRIPSKPEEPGYILLRDALGALARHGDRTGTRLALEVGLEDAATLTAFLATFDTGSLGINFNPANLLVSGHDPYESLRLFGSKLFHAQALDARRVSPNRTATVPVGHGDIDWLQVLAMLEEVEYAGFLDVLGDDLAELQTGVAFLQRIMTRQ